MISVSGVKIVESLFKEQIHHPAYLLIVDLIIFHRQSHHAESKMLFYFFEFPVIHFPFPLFQIYGIICASFQAFSGRQCMCVCPSTRKPSAWEQKLRSPKSAERSFRYSASCFASSLPAGNWLVWHPNSASF